MSLASSAREEEDLELSSAIRVALATLKEIASDETSSTDDRIDCASRILGYAATFQPEFNISVDEGENDGGDSGEE